jgi:uncharacterized membrane protein YgdD (TMEM256/DUF423 family)
MIRIWLGAAAVVGFLSVAAGAIGAHLAAGENAAELLRLAALYGLPHAAVLVSVAALSPGRGAPGLALIVAGWAFALGSLLFSLSLVALGLSGIGAIGFLTPFGGLGLLIGWVALAGYAFGFRPQKGLSSAATCDDTRSGIGPG